MAIQPLMGATKASFWVLLAVLFTAAVSLNDREESLDVYLSQLLDPTSGLLDEDTAELLWTCCGLDLMHLKEDIEDLDLCLPQEASGSTNEINSEIRSLAQKNIQKLISGQLPQLKQILLHCLRKNSLPFRVTGEDNQLKILRVPYLKSHLSRFSAPRRNLGLEFPQHVSEASSRSPTPPTSTPLSRRRLSSDSSSASRNASTARFLKATTKEKESDTQTTIIAAVVITASVTFILAALLFMCFSKFCRNGRVRKYDERPLLSLSMSDYSVGSSHRSFANSIKEEKLGFQTSSNSLLDDKNTSSLNGSFHIGSDVLPTTVQESQSIGSQSIGRQSIGRQSIGDVGATVNPPIVLKPPPGRVVSNSTGLPPLKPPPGRPDLLPPEPPLRPSNAAGPPAAPPPPPAAPPPPPAPPQPRKPASVGGAKPAGPPPPPPPARPGARTGPCPPPPPRSGPGPPRPPAPVGPKLGRPGANRPKPAQNVEANIEPSVPKTKLKPFFWDKVQANSDSAMVWNQLKAGSFQFNEEMIESLFGYVNTTEKGKGERRKESAEAIPQYIQIIESKKAQNLSILLKALNVTMEEVCDALFEGNELPAEFIQTLLKMAPTQEEELKLRLYNGELSRLGPADRFLKALVDVPFAYKRLEALLYMGTLEEDLTSTMESFGILEVACKELRSSRLFLKLLEAVLKTGNRMNDGTFRGGALAFKLDTLLKLSDVKGIDGKITLLHFVVQEIIRSEGIRAARVARESRSFSSIKTDDLLDDIPLESPDHYRELGLEVVSNLSNELENVKKAAALDADSLTGTTAKLGHGLVKTKDFLNTELQNLNDDRGFYQTVKSFVESAEDDVLKLLEEEKKIINLVKSTGDYFHGNSGRDEGLRLFSIVRDFLVMLDRVCKEIRDAAQKQKQAKPAKQETARASSSSELRPPPSPDIRQKLFPANSDKRMKDSSSSSSSDDDSP